MKKLLVVLMLAMASTANAAILISVNGVVDPPETEIWLQPSETAVIDLWGDGTDPQGEFYLGISTASTGAGHLDFSGAVVLYPGIPSAVFDYDDEGIADMLGIFNPFGAASLTDTVEPMDPLSGTLVDGIIFHCEGPGDVTLLLFDGTGTLIDTQVIHQIPEPMTMLLLGLGGLFLRRRK